MRYSVSPRLIVYFPPDGAETSLLMFTGVTSAGVAVLTGATSDPSGAGAAVGAALAVWSGAISLSDAAGCDAGGLLFGWHPNPINTAAPANAIIDRANFTMNLQSM